MPTLDIDQFDERPEVGDTVTVTGKVQEIKKGKVDISYDTITVLPGSSDEPTSVTVDESMDKFMRTQRQQEDNIATQ